MPKSPGYRTIVCADVADFSNPIRNVFDHETIREVLYRELTATLLAAGISLDESYHEDRGDGVLLIAPAEIDDYSLIENIPRALTERIGAHNAQESRPGSRFRLRVAAHVGRVTFDEEGVMGDAVILAFRMLNSDQLRAELENSASALVFCTSDYLYSQVVRHTSIAKEFQRHTFEHRTAKEVVWVWPAERRQGRVWAVAALVVLLVGALVAGLTLWSPWDPRPPSLLGDEPRMADPCALADTAALARFGKVKSDGEFGEFSRCELFVTSDRIDADVKVQFYNPASQGEEPLHLAEKSGQIRIIREPRDDDECERRLILPDDYRVEINAIQNDDRYADLCDMADTLTTYAVDTLNNGPLQRRATRAPGSLFHENACTILPLKNLREFPGINANAPDPDFGNWSCGWDSTTDQTLLTVKFDQYVEPNANDGYPTTIGGGHDAFVKPNGYGPESCQVMIPHLPFAAMTSGTKVEVLLIVVQGEQLPDKLCEIALRVAG